MALNPEILKALAGGSRVSSAFDVNAANQGVGAGGAKPGAWNLGQSIIDILSTGGYASAGVTRKVGENVASIQRGDLGGLLDLLNPLSVIPAAGKGVAERRTYSENLRDLGVDKNVSTWLGLALDIGLDPTTYITGGTIAGIKGGAQGVKLASTANKANAVVVRSAAEAATKNLPDTSRPFIPSEVPLTQGQRLGNYLNGVLRGYDFKRAERAAQISVQKINKDANKIARQALKSGNKKEIAKNVDYANEVVVGAQAAGKAATSAIVDNTALINRDIFMKAVAESDVLKARYSKRLDKLNAQKKIMEGTRLAVPVSKEATQADQALAAAKASEAERVMKADPSLNISKQVDEANKTEEIKEIENVIAAEKSFNSEVLTDAEKNKKLKTLGAKKAKISSIKTTYSAISNALLDYAKRNVDPSTGKKLSESGKTESELLSYIVDGLRDGTLKPTADRIGRFATAIGTSSDPAQTAVDLVNKTLIRMSKDLKKMRNLEEEANALSRLLESGGVNANSVNSAAAAGLVNSPDVGRALEDAMDVEGEVNKQITDVINEKLGGGAEPTAKSQEELNDTANNMRVEIAQQLATDINKVKSGGSATAEFRLEYLLRDALEDGPYAQLKELAGERGLTMDEMFLEAANGNKAFINDPRFKLSARAVKLDFFGSEARFSGENAIVNTERALVKKKARTPEQAVEEEALLGRAQDNLYRTINIPVGTEENLLMQLRRSGAKKIGDKLDKNFVPQRVHVTMADILQSAMNAGKTKVFSAIRYPGSSYQNVMPSNIEYAFLTLVRYKSLGKEIKPGSEAWEAIKKSFNENYNIGPRTEGVVSNKDVEDFFVPAKHLDPDYVTTKAGKRFKPKQIPDLDKKIDDAIQVMSDVSDELLEIHAGRAAAHMAAQVSDSVQKTKEVFLELFELLAARESFSQGLVGLIKASPQNPTALLNLGSQAQGVKGLGKITHLMKSLIISSAKAARTSVDAATIDEVDDLIVNMFMKKLVGADKASLEAAVGPAAAQTVSTFITQEFDEVYKSVMKEIKVSEAMGVTKPSTKVTPAQQQKGIDARRKQVEKDYAGSRAQAVQGVKAQDPKTVEEVANPGPLSDEGSNLSSNFVAASDDPVMAGLENILTHGIGEVTDNRLSSRFMTAMSGRFKIGLGLKTLIGGVEYWNSSSVGFFNNGLKAIAEKAGRDLGKVNAAFKVVQQWGKEMAQRVEAGRPEISFAEWARGAEVGNVDMEIADDLAFMVDGLFGVNPEGIPIGGVASTFTQPYFADELNRMFDVRGILDIGDEQAFRIPDKAGPMGVKYSWARAEIGPLKAGSKKKPLDALTFLNNYAHSLHAVQTKIGLGQAYSSSMGKTLKEIEEQNLDKSKFFRADPEDEFGKLLDKDKFFEIDELERMQYLKKYITYQRSFSTETMQNIVNVSDMITSVLKGTQTTWRAGHHVTSIVGEAIMNTLAGVNSPKYYSDAWKILTEFDPSRFRGDANPFRQYMEYSTPKGLQLKASTADTIGYVNSATGKRTIVPMEQIYRLADRYGILTRGGASTVEDLDLRGVGDFANGVVGGVSRANSKLAEISSQRDNFFRMAHFIKEIEKGGIYGSLEEAALAAAKQVTTFHPTIGGLSAFERKYMRRAVYFYTWQRIAATKIAQLIIEKPGAVIIPSKIQYAFAEANGFNPESFGDPWDPNGVYASWHTGSTFGPQFQGPGGAEDAWGIKPAVPQLDILDSLLSGYTVQPGQSGLDVVVKGTQNLAGGNLSPLPKWLAEGITGNRVGSGGDIRNPVEYAIDQVGGLSTISKITGIGREPDLTADPIEEKEKNDRLWINWLTGVRVQDYKTGDSVSKWKADQAEILKRLSGQE
jgi:hypothetical protein